VQRQRKHGWQKLFEFEEQPASVRGLTAATQGFLRILYILLPILANDGF